MTSIDFIAFCFYDDRSLLKYEILKFSLHSFVYFVVVEVTGRDYIPVNYRAERYFRFSNISRYFESITFCY